MYINVWPDFRKPTTHVHNDKANSSIPINSFINNLTKHHCVTTTNKQVCFYWGMSNVHQCLDGLKMAMAALNKQALGCRLPIDWLLLLSIDLTTFCDIWSTRGLYLSPSNLHIFPISAMAPHHPQPTTLCKHLWY